MHLIRRSAFRAIRSSSFVSQPRTISTSSPFVLRSRKEAAVSQIFKRFASDEVAAEKQKEATPDSSSDGQSTFSSVIETTSETSSSYASDAAERFAEAPHEVEQSTGYATGRANERRGTSRGNNYGGHQNFDRPNREFRDNGAARKIEPSTGIYVGNLRFDLGEADIEREFSEYGDVKAVRLAVDSRGLSKGFAYVDFMNTEQAAAAIAARHETIFQGRRMIVNYQIASSTKPRAESEPSKCLFIGNLAYEMSDADLNKLFRDVRNVIDVRVAIDRRTGQPRGFAHADFVDVESAIAGREILAGKDVYGRKLRVDYAATPSRKWRESNSNLGEILED